MSNKLKVILGLGLIAVAFICIIAVSFSIDRRNQSSVQEIDVLQVELANLIAQQSEDILSDSDKEKVERDPIRLEDVLARAQSIYGEAELERKNGILWIDRKSSQMMVTLGVVNGLMPGTYLGVYQEKLQADGTVINEKVDDVVVEKAYDIISYVKSTKKAQDDFNRDYYRVSMKGSF
ncbi:MAG: hypothetical protein P9M07_06150 [Candidatus Aceula meridiana]|nr:hypothetical protein [Candidatus Aceula meridiana]